MNPVSNDRYRRIRGGAGLLQANDTNASKPAAASQSRSATAQEINNSISQKLHTIGNIFILFHAFF